MSKRRDVTYPQRGERTIFGQKLPKTERHKKLKPYYTLVERVPTKRTKLKTYTKLVKTAKAIQLVYGKLVPNPVTGVPNIVKSVRQYAFA